MSIVSRVMTVVALSMSLSLSAGTANAVALTFTGWDYSPGVASANFGRSGLDSSLSYTDWLDFTLPGASDGSGSANVIALKVTTPFTGIIDYFRLWDFTTSSYIGSVVSSGANHSTLAFSGGAVPGSYQLQIGVSGTNAYAGSIATPVPEPQTFAMLLAGLGLLGLSTRRRNSNV